MHKWLQRFYLLVFYKFIQRKRDKSDYELPLEIWSLLFGVVSNSHQSLLAEKKSFTFSADGVHSPTRIA